jgi:putative transposase
LERVYPIVWFDCLMVKVREDRSVRTRACYLAIGATVEGEREVLGIWWQETEGAKFWLAVLNDLYHRGVEDVLVCCVDGLTGFPEAIEAVFPHAWVQTCIVHQIRSSMRFVTYKDRKAVAADPKPVYRAVNADAAEAALEAFDDKWRERYPMIADSWRARWQHITPFLSLPAELRRAVYTTNSIENLNRQIRKTIKTRGHFPDEQAATKLIYLAIIRAQGAWKKPYNWTGALRGLKSTSQTDSPTDTSTQSPRPHTQKVGHPPWMRCCHSPRCATSECRSRTRARRSRM